MRTREQQLIADVERMKKSEYGVTAIKVELEANFGRSYSSGYGSSIDCHDYILEKLVPLGLAVVNDEGYYDDYGDRRSNRYALVRPLVYSKFYNDGSVDSEWTFTLSVDDPRTVLLLPQMIQAFNDLGAAIDSDFDTSNAGMHIAVLNSSDCSYPYSTNRPGIQFDNFKKSMNALMPALFFLSSADHVSREMHFRRPGVTDSSRSDSKYFAINYNGAIEYRVFETCYDYPERILENISVIANTLKYWSSKRCNSIAAKGGVFNFGNDDSRNLERLYNTGELIERLNTGLRYLKPAYLTIAEVKKIRGFNKTKRTFAKQEKLARQKAEAEYADYEYRYEWTITRIQQQYRYEGVRSQETMGSAAAPVTLAELERAAEERIQADQAIPDKQTLPDFIKDRVARHMNVENRYTLSF